MIESLGTLITALTNQVANTDRYNLFCIKSDIDNQLLVREILNRAGIQDVNIGFEMAENLISAKEAKFINIEAQEFLQMLIETKSNLPDNFKLKTVAIYNLGILFEPLLGLHPISILKELSKTTAIILLWEGQTDNNGKLFWDAKKPQIGLDFFEINLKEINIQHAI